MRPNPAFQRPCLRQAAEGERWTTQYTMTRYLSIAVALAALVPLSGYLLSSAIPFPPLPVVALILFLCPSFAWLGATAACEYFDRCSLSMLGWIVGANVLLYGCLAVVLWFTRTRFKAARVMVLGAVGLASARWVRLWIT